MDNVGILDNEKTKVADESGGQRSQISTKYQSHIKEQKVDFSMGDPGEENKQVVPQGEGNSLTVCDEDFKVLDYCKLRS